MCVVALACNVHPRWRLVLAGNRDEFHPRPTASLARWPGTGILAGRDLQSGGTWLGLDGGGRVAVVTNVRDGLAPPHAGPSRGALPLAFLAGDASAAATAKRLRGEGPAYAPFNLLLADADACWHLGNHPPRDGSLARGVHAISNGGLDAPWPKTHRLGRALQAWVEAGHDDLRPLWNALADERGAPDGDLPDTGVGLALERTLAPVFIRGPAYGTRASSIVLVGHDGRGLVHERRFGPDGVFEGETALANHD